MWNINGCLDTEFMDPIGMTILNEEVFVAYKKNNLIQVFSMNGDFLRKWTHKEPISLCCSDKSVFVGSGNGEIHEYL